MSSTATFGYGYATDMPLDHGRDCWVDVPRLREALSALGLSLGFHGPEACLSPHLVVDETVAIVDSEDEEPVITELDIVSLFAKYERSAEAWSSALKAGVEVLEAFCREAGDEVSGSFKANVHDAAVSFRQADPRWFLVIHYY